MSSNGVTVPVTMTVTVSDSMSDDIYHDSWLHVNPRTFRNASHSFNVTNVWVANWKHNGVPSVPPLLPAYHPLICPTTPSYTCPTTPLSARLPPLPALPPPYLPWRPIQVTILMDMNKGVLRIPVVWIRSDKLTTKRWSTKWPKQIHWSILNYAGAIII